MITVAAALLLVLAGAAPPCRAAVSPVALSGERFRLSFEISPIGNLTYQLDCLARGESCSQDAYRQFWREKLGWSEEDEKALGEWRSIMEKYSRQVEFSEDSPADSPLPVRNSYVDLYAKWRIAGLRSPDLREYRANIGLLMTPSDAAKTLSIASRFQKRFAPWWESTGLKQLQAAREGYLELARQKRLGAFYEDAAKFYGNRLQEPVNISIDLLARPKAESEGTNATQIENRLLVESLEGEKPENRIDVVSHELFHYFYESAPIEDRVSLLHALARAKDDASLAAEGLLDESLATALGNGLVSRRVLPPDTFQELLRKDESFYADAFIDATAKALLPVLESYLRAGKGLGDPGFVSDYLASVEAALGARRFSPQLFLRNLVLAYDKDLEASTRLLRRQLRTKSVFSFSPIDDDGSELLRKHQGLSGVVFVTTAGLDRLKGWEDVLGSGSLQRLRNQAAKGHAFVQGFKRSSKAYVFVFVGPDDGSLETVVNGFIRAPAVFAGLQKPPMVVTRGL